MRHILKYLKPYWWQLIILVASLCLQAWASLQLPNYMAEIVNSGIVGGNQSLIQSNGFTMLLITAIGGIAMVLTGYLASKIGTGFARSLREAVFVEVESFSLNEIDKFSTASLITRTTNDTQQLQLVMIMILRMVAQAPIMAIGAIINAWHTAPNMSWIIAVGVIALFVMIAIIFSVVIPKFNIVQKMVDKLNLVARENLTGLRIIRAFRNEKYEEKKFDDANVDLTKLNLFVNRAMSLVQPLMMFIFNLVTLLIVWTGAHLVSDGNIEIGNMMAFMQYSMQVIMSFLMLSMLMIFIPRAQVSANRLSEVLSTELSLDTPKSPKKLGIKNRGLVEFRDVTFTYNKADTPVLNDISFTAQPGQTTAFIGSTGSGKSTLINLIPRFYDVTAGQVLINGIDVRKMSAEDLTQRIGYVPQKGVLFSGTIASNIKYGVPKATNAEMKKAARIAQADFIKKLSGGFNHHIAQGGSNVSGGQKQRLSIARAVIKNPDIYIFDDSFSAVDYKTDVALRKALAPVTKNSTVLIVAQRISTIKSADQIIVMDEGKIVDIGTHEKLLRDCKVYQEIASSQLSDSELSTEMERAKGRK